jgi:hypothetical protein
LYCVLDQVLLSWFDKLGKPSSLLGDEVSAPRRRELNLFDIFGSQNPTVDFVLSEWSSKEKFMRRGSWNTTFAASPNLCLLQRRKWTMDLEGRKVWTGRKFRKAQKKEEKNNNEYN